MMKTYTESAADRYGITAKQRLLRIFDAFRWPDAAEEEFVPGTESSLLFLNRYGLVLRTGERLYAPESDLILRPLASVDAGRDCVIDLLPGVRAIAEDWTVAPMLGAVLEDEDIDFHDTTAQNVGYIPAALPGFPYGVPVVIDRGAVSELSRAFREYNPARNKPEVQTLRQSFNRETLRGFQEKFYAPLREGFEAAWPKGGKPDRAGVSRFLSLCAVEVEKGESGQPAMLSNRWTRSDFDAGKPPKAAAAALRYELRLRAMMA